MPPSVRDWMSGAPSPSSPMRALEKFSIGVGDRFGEKAERSALRARELRFSLNCDPPAQGSETRKRRNICGAPLIGFQAIGNEPVPWLTPFVDHVCISADASTAQVRSPRNLR